MKLTPQDVLGEDWAPEPSGKKRPPKQERPQKKQTARKKRPPRRKRNGPDPDEGMEPAEGMEPISEEQESEGTPDDRLSSEPEDEGGPHFEEVLPEPRGLSKKAITGIVLALVFGFILFAVGMRGVIGAMALEDTAYEPAKSYDASYQAALDASEETFDEVNAQRLAAASQEASEEEGAAAEDPETKPSETEEITVEDLDNTTSKDEQIQLLQEEVERLKQEAEEAKTSAATMEQELNNAQSLLDASTAREEQLRNELDALSGNTK